MIPEDWISLTGTLLAGLIVGWLWRGWLYRRRVIPHPGETAPQARQPPAPPRREAQELRRQLEMIEAELSERQRTVERHETELAKANAELARRDRELKALRHRLEERDEAHARLVRELGERRARLNETGADLYRVSQELIRREEELNASLEALAERNQELEMFAQLDASYKTELYELTQEIQLRDGEVTRLKAVLRAKQSELAEAQALLDQRESELGRIIRSRERIEREIALAEEQLSLVTRERDRLLSELQEVTDDADQRARLLRALRDESHPAAGPLPVEVGYGGPGDRPAEEHPPALEPPEDDLTRIRGIGEGYARMLNVAGIHTFEQLAATTPDELRKVLTAPQWRTPDVEAWIAEARALASGDEPPVLEAGRGDDDTPAEHDDEFPDIPWDYDAPER